jgi:hypothetical protein
LLTMEGTCMAASFLSERRFGKCNKPGKWVVM